jgi:hypothetical protein
MITSGDSVYKDSGRRSRRLVMAVWNSDAPITTMSMRAWAQSVKVSHNRVMEGMEPYPQKKNGTSTIIENSWLEKDLSQNFHSLYKVLKSLCQSSKKKTFNAAAPALIDHGWR